MKPLEEQGYWPGGFVRRRTGREELPRAVFLHDSFLATYMEPFLSEHFEEVTYYWQENVPYESILSQSPDIVVELRVERIFDSHVPDARGLLQRRTTE
jgi:hypothetical protein